MDIVGPPMTERAPERGRAAAHGRREPNIIENRPPVEQNGKQLRATHFAN